MRQLVGAREQPRIERTVPEVLVHAAVQRLRARLGDHVHLARARRPELGGVAGRFDLELANRVRGQVDDVGVERRIRVGGAIYAERVRARPPARDADRRVLAWPPVEGQRRTGGRAMRRMRAGHQQGELEELAAIERQLRDLPLVDHLADRGADGVEQRHRLAHDDLRRYGARLQLEVEAQPLVDFEPHVDARRGESRQAGGQPELSGLQPGDLECAVLRARGCAREAAVRVLHRDSGAGYREILLVEDEAGNRARRVLGPSGRSTGDETGDDQRGEADVHRRQKGHYGRLRQDFLRVRADVNGRK